MSERTFVTGLKAGDQIDQVFAVRDRILRERRDGIPYLKLRLGDKTGELDAVLWDDALAVNSRIANQDFVRVRGRVERYQRSNSLNISMIEPVPAETVNAQSFLPETPRSRKELWRQIETFARFSFCKGHSAAFAVLSYQVTYLKAHYPAEFMAAVLANGGGYYGAAAYIQECRRMGLRVRRSRPPWRCRSCAG